MCSVHNQHYIRPASSRSSACGSEVEFCRRSSATFESVVGACSGGKERRSRKSSPSDARTKLSGCVCQTTKRMKAPDSSVSPLLPHLLHRPRLCLHPCMKWQRRQRNGSENQSKEFVLLLVLARALVEKIVAHARARPAMPGRNLAAALSDDETDEGARQQRESSSATPVASPSTVPSPVHEVAKAAAKRQRRPVQGVRTPSRCATRTTEGDSAARHKKLSLYQFRTLQHRWRK